ncbi:hypothetical protein ACFYO0_03710 [Streptomyces sp. NPDC006365]|uniref:hypothetical protein n=1 Tax=Streptomyces sp. NPDC006365 TaxID=3364744 RepID=UPI0036B13811
MSVNTRSVKVRVMLAALMLLFVSVLAVRALSDKDVSDLTWKYDKFFDGKGTIELSAVMATADDDIWVAGTTRFPPEPADADGAFLQHYDGTRWQRRPMPASFGDSVHDARFDTVDSGGFLLTASLDLNAVRMAHWDGTRWTALPKLPNDPRVSDVRAFDTDDIWVLDDQSNAYHWDGTSWTAMKLPVTITALDGVAPDDLWAVGFHEPYDDDDPALPFTQPAGVHWDGRAWKSAPMPEYRFKVWPTEPHAGLTEVVALAKDNVRAYGNLASYSEDDESDPPDEDVRLRWNGTRWTKLPNAKGACADRGRTVRDGERGAVVSPRRYLTADGDCETIAYPKLPSIQGKQWFRLNAITAVPGTAKILGIGSVASASSDPTYEAMIVSLKR